MSMEYLETRELENSIKGIELGFENINHLTDLYSSIKNSRYILVPNNVIKTINITLESIHKKYQIENISTISLEDKEDTTIFQRILATIKTIWKKIVETWNYIWDRIIGFFTGSSNKVSSIKQDVEKREKKIKTLEANLKNLKIEDNSKKIEIQSIIDPLNYLNKELKDQDQIDLVKINLPNIRATLASNIVNLDHVYSLTEKFIKTDEVKKSKSVEEIDSKLYTIFLNNLSNTVFNFSELDTRLNGDDIDIVKSILHYENIIIDKNKSKVSKGYIRGGCIYFCLINSEDDEHSSFECIAINKKQEDGHKSILYYLTFSGVTEINQLLKQEMKDFDNFFDSYNRFYKKIKDSHNSIRKEIEVFINDKNVVSIDNPDNFRTKFEILKNITHSMLRYGLELTKGVGMYQDTLNYYNKLLDVNFREFDRQMTSSEPMKF